MYHHKDTSTLPQHFTQKRRAWSIGFANQSQHANMFPWPFVLLTNSEYTIMAVQFANNLVLRTYDGMEVKLVFYTLYQVNTVTTTCTFHVTRPSPDSPHTRSRIAQSH
jgi:hypothetical protein